MSDQNKPSLISAVQAWQASQLTQEEAVAHFTALQRDEGHLVRQAITDLLRSPDPGAPVPSGAASPTTDAWRAELMAGRARTWHSPEPAGLLVGPTVLILTDGQRGVVLSAGGTRRLSSSVSASLMLLCQTIVLAQSALNEREMGALRQQRVESASTSMSEIEIIP
ncbi:hypothetical protein [Deinococcus depolymerans]|uniref:Uncharacterized protein n=1 Tax=Deinococcus depolymerans TaxID=392408 RepID=A0ABN1C955_9DEIO